MEQDVEIGAVNIPETVPTYVVPIVVPIVVAVVAPVFTFIGSVAVPRIQWGIDKKRELRQHRRQLIAKWHTMVGDVSQKLSRIEETAGYKSGYSPSDVLCFLMRHPDCSSFQTAYDEYSCSGIRGIMLKYKMSSCSRMLQRLRMSSVGRRLLGPPKLVPHPEMTLTSSPLPVRLSITIGQIGEIERWWKLHK